MNPGLKLALLAVLAAACGSPPPEATQPDAEFDFGADSADSADSCPSSVTLGAADRVTVEGNGRCELTIVLEAAAVLELTASPEVGIMFGEPAALDEPGWVAPRLVDAGSHPLTLDGEAWSATLENHGGVVAPIDRARSLVWTDPALLDDRALLGLGRLMRAAAAQDDEAGALFGWWLRRFATTAHSERVGPQQFLETLAEQLGGDPATWDLDVLPFVVTGVHNRLDLAAGEHCGELRVSIASTHPEFQPFHAIFLFQQAPAGGDVSPGGVVHCGETTRRWAELSALTEPDFREAARAILADAVARERFLMVETVEFIISPWEWRQWLPAPNVEAASPSRVFDNPPLFQTLDVARINTGGTLRTEFLDFVAQNAAALDARRLAFPARFRPPSARVNAGVPWVPLDLDGVDPAITAELPDLRRNLEIVGCPACHATDADFIQTRPDRTFSPFYDKELDARAMFLVERQRGAPPEPVFGPLQPDPRLPP